jgi:MFS family permease
MKHTAKINPLEKILSWLICGIGMLFYFYNFFLRVSPSVMHEELMQGFHIGAYQFGMLSAFYYYAYTPMQIPAGILYDRYGARLVQFIAVLIATLGLGIFILTDTFWLACLGRFLIGLGGAFAYIGVMKLVTNWLPPERFALAAGITTTFGMCAAIFSDMYLSKLVHQAGYQDSLIIGLVIGVALSIIILIFMRNHPKNNQYAQSSNIILMEDVLRGFKNILTSKQMWLIGIIGCLTYLPSSVFLDLWGIPYLKTAYYLTSDQAGNLISAAFLGWIVGGPLIGGISDHIKQRRLPLIASYLIATILFVIVFYVPNLSYFEIVVSLFFIGLVCGSHPLCIALGKENNPIQFSGVSVAFSNCITMLGGVIFQPMVGKLLDYHAGALPLLQHSYNKSDFVFALSIIPVGLFVSVCLTFFLKETRCSIKVDYVSIIKRSFSRNSVQGSVY